MTDARRSQDGDEPLDELNQAADADCAAERSASQQAEQGGQRTTIGLWANDDPRRLFVEGAAWWQFTANGSTMFDSERNAAEAEAARRFPEGTLPSLRKPHDHELLRDTEYEAMRTRAERAELDRNAIRARFDDDSCDNLDRRCWAIWPDHPASWCEGCLREQVVALQAERLKANSARQALIAAAQRLMEKWRALPWPSFECAADLEEALEALIEAHTPRP